MADGRSNKGKTGKSPNSKASSSKKPSAEIPTARKYHRLHQRPSTPPIEMYLGRQVDAGGLERAVLIKTLPIWVADYSNYRPILLDEAAALLAAEHPHVVRLLEVTEDEAGLHLVRENLDGVGLLIVLHRLNEIGETMPPPLAAHIASEILWVLDHIHSVTDPEGESLDMVHRGIHPSQIWLTPTGHIRLDGFGLTRMSGRRQSDTEPGLLKGFSSYLPPEYIAGEPVTSAIDVYAVGIMLYELLTANRAFSGQSTQEVLWKIIHEGVSLKPLEALRISPMLTNIVSRSTQPSPEARFYSASSMAQALDEFVDDTGAGIRPWQLRAYLTDRGLYGSAVQDFAKEGETTQVDLVGIPELLSEGE